MCKAATNILKFGTSSAPHRYTSTSETQLSSGFVERSPATLEKRIPINGWIESNPLYQMLPPLKPETLREVGRYLPKES